MGRNGRYKIPDYFRAIFNKNFQLAANDDVGDIGVQFRKKKHDEIMALLEAGLKVDNYRDLFHCLLWLEELSEERDIKKHNRKQTKLSPDNSGKHGLVFKWKITPDKDRKYLLKGDEVRVDDHLGNIFHGTVVQSKMDFVAFKLVRQGNNDMIAFDQFGCCSVKLKLNRANLVNMHAAVDQADKFSGRLFPIPNRHCPEVKTIQNFFNAEICSNYEQTVAVENIVAGSSGGAPYIVFGPPGTGKTFAIAEAILQIVTKDPESKIIACAHSNIAADNLALKIIQSYKKKNNNVPDNLILRLNSKRRPWDYITKELAKYSDGNCKKSWKKFTIEKVSSYRIIVTTLLRSNTLKRLSKQSLTATHLFIDEAAQAIEPSNLVPIDTLLKPDGQLVLAGDTKQLGPIVKTTVAAKQKLELSLMARLIAHYGNLYNIENPNNKYITVLDENFRSDKDIIEIPNKLFYNNKLKAKAPIDDLNINSLKKKIRAVMFHAVQSQEMKDDQTESYFNPDEVSIVMKYVKVLFEGLKIEMKDIGVITPYKKQASVLKEHFEKHQMVELEIGTVDAFQGREKRAIVISTGRSKKIGFLSDSRRFNVALTRAKAKLIVIGNEECLKKCENWNEYIEYCKSIGTYRNQVDAAVFGVVNDGSGPSSAGKSSGGKGVKPSGSKQPATQKQCDASLPDYLSQMKIN